jgi:hypothetical protein
LEKELTFSQKIELLHLFEENMKSGRACHEAPHASPDCEKPHPERGKPRHCLQVLKKEESC